MFSQMRSYGSNEFVLVCPGAFVGLIFCGFGVLLWRSGEDFVVQQPDHPRPKYVQRSRLLIFLDGRLKGLSETYEGSQVRAGIRVTLMLLRSDCIFSTEALVVFHVAKIDTTKKKTQRDFIVILRYMSYFVVSWVYDSKHCTCNCCRV